MASHRIEKINGQIQRELSLIIQQKMKDSRFNRDTLSITNVKAAPDLKTATVYVSIFGTPEEKEEVLGLLDNAKGFLRANLGKVLKVHSIPRGAVKNSDGKYRGLSVLRSYLCAFRGPAFCIACYGSGSRFVFKGRSKKFRHFKKGASSCIVGAWRLRDFVDCSV